MASEDRRFVVMEEDRAIPGGVATLDESGKLAAEQRPSYTVPQVEGLDKAISSLSDEVEALQTVKQDKLTGLPGQLIGIGEDGTAQATVYPSNKSLLDNWYFVGGGSQQGGGQFPINQRGQKEYTTNGISVYSIDRWKKTYTQLFIESDGLKLVRSGDAGSYHFYQCIEPSRIPAGRTITFSIYVKQITGTFRFGLIVDNVEALQYSPYLTSPGVYTVTAEMPDGINLLIPSIYMEPNAEMKLAAAKLELGSVQTLAHKEGDTWVLNDPPPNYAQELLKCQRYYWKSDAEFFAKDPVEVGDGNQYIGVNVKFPVRMRARPAVTLVSVNGTPNILSSWWTRDDTSISPIVIDSTLTDEGFDGMRVNGATSTGVYSFRVIENAEL